MAYECFELKTEGGVAHLQLSRPERRNAMTAAFWQELPEIVRSLDAKVLVLSSTGPHFCAGLDVSMFGSGALTTESVEGRQEIPPKTRRTAIEPEFPRRGAVPGDRGGAGRLHRRRRGHGDRLLPALRHARRVLRDPGNQPRHDGRRRHLQPHAQAAARGGGARTRLHRRPAVRASAPSASASSTACSTRTSSWSRARWKSRGASPPRRRSAIAATKQMISYTRDHSVAESFDYLNALQPAIFDIEEIKRSLKKVRT